MNRQRQRTSVVVWKWLENGKDYQRVVTCTPNTIWRIKEEVRKDGKWVPVGDVEAASHEDMLRGLFHLLINSEEGTGTYGRVRVAKGGTLQLEPAVQGKPTAYGTVEDIGTGKYPDPLLCQQYLRELLADS